MLLSVSLAVGATVFQANVADPGVRNAHGAAYDVRDNSLVLFGGATADEVRGDTWRWKDGSWRLCDGAGPGPRTFPTMAYDAARGEIVLFGGNRVLFGDSTHPTTMLGDTWVLRGDTLEGAVRERTAAAGRSGDGVRSGAPAHGPVRWPRRAWADRTSGWATPGNGTGRRGPA